MRERVVGVRLRTTIVATLVVAAALAAGAIALVALQHRTLVDGLDRTARIRAGELAALVRAGSVPVQLSAGKEDDSFAQVVDPSGHVLAASDNLEGEGAVTHDRPPTGRAAVATRNVGPLGGTFRVVAETVGRGAGSRTVLVGESLRRADDATGRLGLLLAAGLPALLAVVVATTWTVTGRALHPVESIRREVEAIGADQLGRRVPEPRSRDEVARLARTMNAMLARLENAAVRQRRFVSDASHELQSPLTALRARLELDLADPGRADAVATELEALGEVKDMQRTVEDLLELTRLDAGTAIKRRELVDLDDLVLREAERLRTRGRVRVDLHDVSAGQVRGDPSQLRRALRNLVDNAERYADSTVAISVGEHGGLVTVAVADDGPGVPPDARERIFDPFTRLDDARTRDAGNTGLGLAITRDIIRAHGGLITLESGATGPRFVITLPAQRR